MGRFALKCLSLGLGLLSVVLAADVTDDTNKVAWMLNCQGCHRADGSATKSEVPAIRDQVAKFLWVPGGREFLIRVPGVSMSPLSDREVAALTNWMLREFDASHLPADFEPFTQAEVHELRSGPYGSEAASVREKLMSQLSARPHHLRSRKEEVE